MATEGPQTNSSMYPAINTKTPGLIEIFFRNEPCLFLFLLFFAEFLQIFRFFSQNRAIYFEFYLIFS